MPPRGMGYWQRLDEVIQREPIDERDRFFHAMLKPLGIEKGKPFKPDARQTKDPHRCRAGRRGDGEGQHV